LVFIKSLRFYYEIVIAGWFATSMGRFWVPMSVGVLVLQRRWTIW